MATDEQALLLQVSADTSKAIKQLDALSKKLSGVANDTGKASHKAEGIFANFFGKAEPGKALENVFSRSRLAVIEEGAAKIPLFGSAIEALGPVGLGAAAGLGALFLTMERSEKAVEWAAGIAKLSKEVGVSTTFVQQFNFAARQNEIDVGAADGALKSLNASLGLVQSGLARKQLANAFKAIGFSPDQLRQFKDAGEFFPVLVDRIAKVGNAAEQAAIAKRLGVEELLPMLRDGANGFSALAAKARDLGIVMDESAIRKAEEAKKKLSELDDVMKAKANITFAEFADTLVTIKTAFLEAEKAGLHFLAAITNTESPSNKYQSFVKAQGGLLDQMLPTFQAHHQERAFEILKGMMKDFNTPAEGEGAAAKAKALVDGKTGKGPHDDTDAKRASVTEALAGAVKAQLEAEKALTANVEARADMERQIVQQELTAKVARLEKEKSDLAKDKGFKGDKAAAMADLDLAIVAEQKAAAAKRDLIDREADWAAEDRADETRRLIRDAEIAQLELAADLATTQKERARIEAEIAKIKALELQHEQGKALSRAEQTGAISDAEGAQRFGAAQSAAAAQAGRESRQRTLDTNPIAAYAARVKDLDTLFQDDAVHAIESFSTGLADAILNAKSLGDVVSNVFRQLLAEMISQLVQREAASAAMAIFGIPGFAGGTNSAPGGLALVGERGPEILNIPKGGQIIPNHAIANGVRGGGQTIVYQTFHLDGAVTTDALMQHIDAVSTQKAMGAVGTAKTETLKALATARANRMGR